VPACATHPMRCAARPRRFARPTRPSGERPTRFRSSWARGGTATRGSARPPNHGTLCALAAALLRAARSFVGAGAHSFGARGRSRASLPCTFPVPSLYLPGTFPVQACARGRSRASLRLSHETTFQRWQVRSTVEAVLTEAKAPVLPSEHNEGAISLCPSLLKTSPNDRAR
jgi:hypothetical protein